MNRITKANSLLLALNNNSSRCLYSSSAHADDFMFPSVRRLLREYNLTYSQVKPTGPQGRLVKGDVISYVESNKLKPVEIKLDLSAPVSSSAQSQPQVQQPTTSSTTTTTSANKVKPPQYQDEPHNNIRKVIASKLTQSKQSVPHMYMTVQCEIDKLLSLRTTLNANSTSKISVNDFVIKACALALRDVPAANSKWDNKAGQIVNNPTVDISVAVATDRGLITPIVKMTDTKSLGNIATELKDLAGRARASKLKPEEFQGGTFSVSNLGMYGITHFNAIINYPQAGILAIGGGRKIVKNKTFTLDDLDNLDANQLSSKEPSVVNVIDVTLSGDNRVFDDEIAAVFLDTFKKYISNPQLMML